MKKNIRGLIFKVKPKNTKVGFGGIRFKRKSTPKVNIIASRLSKQKLLKRIVLFFVSIFSVLLIVSLAYLAYKYIFNLRNVEDVVHTENVFGFEIPSYPTSEFIFKNNLEDETVKSFLSLGNSVYRLPKDIDILDVFTYYSEQLPAIGWKHTLSVPITSEEKMYGEYWIKGEMGLRIYSRLNDVWYQSITTKQAENGLEDVVKKETARRLLLLTTEKTDLLPDFPWRLSYPTEYTTKYYSSTVPSLQGVYFQKIGSDQRISLEPMGYFGGSTFVDYIEKYLEASNKKNKTKWRVVNSVETTNKGYDIVKATIVSGKKSGVSIAIKNDQNTAVYVITTYEDNDPFFNYILANIKPSLLNSL